MDENKPKISTRSITALADEYNVHPDTMRKWLKLGKLYKRDRLYTPKEVKAIYEHLGYPF